MCPLWLSQKEAIISLYTDSSYGSTLFFVNYDQNKYVCTSVCDVDLIGLIMSCTSSGLG